MATPRDIKAAVLEAAVQKQGTLITVADIEEVLPQFEHKPIVDALGALRRSRRLTSLGRGTYLYLPPEGEELSETHIAKEPSIDEVQEVLATLPEKPKKLPSEARKEPEAVIETVDPKTAAYYLTANVKNRDRRASRVQWLAGILRRGEWRLTQDGVGFDTAGFLLNGQHRLGAIMVAGKPAPLVVIRGLQSKSQDVMDRALPRSLGDSLKLRGEHYTNALGAALMWSYRLEYIEKTGQVHFRSAGERPTTVQLLSLLEANPEIRDAVADTSRAKARSEVPVRSGLISALIHRFRQLDKLEANLFLDKLVDGTELTATDPIFVVRRALLQDKQRGFERMPDYREAALLVKAWNLWREQKPVERITFKYGPTHREPFPRIH